MTPLPEAAHAGEAASHREAATAYMRETEDFFDNAEAALHVAKAQVHALVAVSLELAALRFESRRSGLKITAALRGQR